LLSFRNPRSPWNGTGNLPDSPAKIHFKASSFGGKFPRLVKKDTNARLGEIKKLLLAL
jgi:hypothetical protein